MVCDLFVDAYRAGASGQDGNYGIARVSRAKLIEKIAELYDEIEDLKISNQAYDHVLTKKNEEIAHLSEENERRHELIRQIVEGRTCEGLKNRLSGIYGSKLTDPENPDSPLWSDYEPGPDDIPDDGGKFSEQDLPFPDVEDLAPASELLGGEE